MRVITLIVSLAIIQFLSLIFNVVIIRLQTCLMMTRLSPSRNDRRKTLEIYTGNSPSPFATLMITWKYLNDRVDINESYYSYCFFSDYSISFLDI